MEDTLRYFDISRASVTASPCFVHRGFFSQSQVDFFLTKTSRLISMFEYIRVCWIKTTDMGHPCVFPCDIEFALRFRYHQSVSPSSSLSFEEETDSWIQPKTPCIDPGHDKAGTACIICMYIDLTWQLMTSRKINEVRLAHIHCQRDAREYAYTCIIRMYVCRDVTRAGDETDNIYIYAYIRIHIHVIQIQVQRSANLTASYTRDVLI